jgi:hypothetical protein
MLGLLSPVADTAPHTLWLATGQQETPALQKMAMKAHLIAKYVSVRNR